MANVKLNVISMVYFALSCLLYHYRSELDLEKIAIAVTLMGAREFAILELIQQENVLRVRLKHNNIYTCIYCVTP